MLKSLDTWLAGVAVALGGPGLFVIAFLDSSFLSFPLINDSLVVLMVRRDRGWMPYYAGMTTIGSLVTRPF